MSSVSFTYDGRAVPEVEANLTDTLERVTILLILAKPKKLVLHL